MFLKNHYTYIANTALVATKKRYQGNTLKETLTYTYDIGGNIAGITKNNVLSVRYYYDALGQLIRENNKEQNKTVTYTYTGNGNLYYSKVYPYTEGTLGTGTFDRNLSYADSSSPDKLTGYGSQLLTYDAAGNPLNYRDGITMIWDNGRELAVLYNGTTSATYTYDSYGRRIKKTVNGTTTNYYYDDADNLFAAGNVFIYYGPNGEATSLKYGGSRYYLVKNLQGDVTALADTNGNLVAQYTYDAWGKPLTITDGNGNNVKNNASHIANLNPLRYRSYVYDNESGFYYLMSRYYDPTVGRFISPDGQLNLSTMHGCNLYAYCENDPVNYVDLNGTFPVHRELLLMINDGGEGKTSRVLTASIFLDQLKTIIFNNVSASAGISLGLSAGATIGKSNIEATVARMDIVGVQLREGEVLFGHPGRVAYSIGAGPFSVGYQSDTFESFGFDERIEYEDEMSEGSIGHGASAVLGVGIHYDISLSITGVIEDLIKYKKLFR